MFFLFCASVKLMFRVCALPFCIHHCAFLSPQDPLDRPAAEVLLKHQWIKDFTRKEDEFDMADYVRNLFPDIDTVAQGPGEYDGGDTK